MEVAMSHQSVNEIFQSYANTLYTAASRMIDKRHPQYEDKVQDLVILAYEEFLSKAEQGKVMSLPLLIHFMKLRKPEVQIEMRGYSRTHKTDVFNKRNYYEGKTELYSINSAISSDGEDTFADCIADETNLEEELSATMEIEAKLSSLKEYEQTIVRMKMSGYDENEIARALSVQPQTIRNAIRSISNKLFEKSDAQTSLSL
jgi:DNA-directed RNA polymerase specialized sigma24 family protein